MARVAAIIFHPPAAPGAGPLTTILAQARARNAEHHRAGFADLGTDAEIVDASDEFERVRAHKTAHELEGVRESVAIERLARSG